MTPTALIEAHRPLVDAIARTLRARTLTGAELDDLVGWGSIGLVEAAHRFDPARGASFAAFAHRRIQGAMLDGARAYLGGRKSVRATRVDSGPTAGEDTFDNRLRGLVVADPGPRADDVLSSAQLAAAVRAAVAALPERERALVEAYDLSGETLTGAGRALGVSKPWASQVRTRALRSLRDTLADAS